MEAGEGDELEFVAHRPSSRWNFAIVVSSRLRFQLNDGEQL
jgi:hypothetical protein